MRDNDWLTLVVGLAAAAFAVLVYGWVVCRTGHRPALDVAGEGAATKAGWGVVIGVGMFGAVIVDLVTAGYATMSGPKALVQQAAAASMKPASLAMARAPTTSTAWDRCRARRP